MQPTKGKSGSGQVLKGLLPGGGLQHLVLGLLLNVHTSEGASGPLELHYTVREVRSWKSNGRTPNGKITRFIKY